MWQISENSSTPWTTFYPVACISAERQYRMGLLFTEGRIVAMGKDIVYNITADPGQVKISVDISLAGRPTTHFGNLNPFHNRNKSKKK